MNFDSLFCINLINGENKFNFADTDWMIKGDKKSRNVTLVQSDPDVDIDIQSLIFNKNSPGSLVLGNSFYCFNDGNLIAIDNSYRVLSTISFNWKYKVLLFVMLKMTKIKFSSTISEIRKMKNGNEIVDNLRRILNYYNNSDLNVADNCD